MFFAWLLSMASERDGVHGNWEENPKGCNRGVDMTSGSRLSRPDFNPDEATPPILGPSLDELDNRLLLGRELCPVCESMFIAPLRYVFGNGAARRYLLRVCLECRSVWNSPTLLDARGDTVVEHPEFAVPYHIEKIERNFVLAKRFFEGIATKGAFDSVLEIGCGVGATLKVASDIGLRVCGYDVSEAAVEKGRELFNLPLFAGQWTHETVQTPFRLVLCVMVLEHLAWPLSLIHELATYCKRVRAVLFVSVPRFLRIYWSHLLGANPKDLENMFKHSHSHFTHFSEEGLEGAFRKYGCAVQPYYIKDSWGGILCDFREKGAIR